MTRPSRTRRLAGLVLGALLLAGLCGPAAARAQEPRAPDASAPQASTQQKGTEQPGAPATRVAGTASRSGALFDEGVTLYRRGEYASAAARFEAALGGNLLPAQRVRVLRARGNCAYRTGDALQAVGWYTAALRLAPRDEALWVDVELARTAAGLPPADRGDLRSTFARLVDSFRPEEARLLALLGAAVLVLAILAETWMGGRVARVCVWSSAGLALLLAVPWLIALDPGPQDPLLVLRADPVPLRAEPRADLTPTATLEPCSVVDRRDALDGWVQVEGPGGERGWVAEDAVFALRR